MSTLTKICVVVLVVLVLVACPIFITRAVTGPNWKEAFEAEHRLREVAEAAAAERGLAAGVWKDLFYEQFQRAENLTERLRTDVDDKRREIARLLQDKADLKATIDKLTANGTELQTALNKAIALNEAQGAELKKERDKNIDLGSQLTRAQAKIEELLSDVSLLKRARQVLEEQVANKDGEIADLRDQIRRLEELGLKAVARKPAVTGPKIEGTVTAVKGDIASLNVGSASGVKKDMQFIVYREFEFVAHLQIEYVTASTCSGIIVDAQRDVKVNDKATTSLEED